MYVYPIEWINNLLLEREGEFSVLKIFSIPCHAEGQLISESLLYVLDFSKKQLKKLMNFYLRT